jgi:ribosome recycling factor
MSDYLPDVKKYAPNANEAHVAAIVKYCGIALRNADSSLVSVSDDKEKATVRNGFAAKKLGLDAAAADKGIAVVADKMKDEKRKSRVTFYYLLAEATGTLGKLG